MVARLVGATERLRHSPQSGCRVPETPDRDLREVIERPYRIVYQIAGENSLAAVLIGGPTNFASDQSPFIR